ncbi:MAG: EamA family transporter [Deltaproteobacteria bacterium]|nr:EamA family transporter [Deltaproteobacteria bacterium]
MSLLVFLLIIFSAFLHALWNFTTKQLSGNLAVIYISLWVASVACFPFLFFLSWSDIHLSSGYPYFLATGLTHAFYFFGLSKAYEYGDISTVYPIARGLGVAGTALLAYLLLREDISVFGSLGIISICLGTIFIGFKLSYQAHHYKGLIMAVFVGLAIVAYSIIDKQAMKQLHPVAYIFSLFFFAAVFLTPYIIVKRRGELSKAWQTHWKSIFVIGIGSMTTYLIILFVFKLANVSYVVAARESAVVIGAFLGFKFLNEKYSFKKASGISLIVLGLILIKVAG